jgi:hypothetical protein
MYHKRACGDWERQKALSSRAAACGVTTESIFRFTRNDASSDFFIFDLIVVLGVYHAPFREFLQTFSPLFSLFAR